MTDERKALYWLSAGGLSVRQQNELLEIYGSALEIFSEFPSEKLKEFAGKTAYGGLKRLHDESVLDKELHALAAAGVRVLLRGYDGYPELLNQPEVEPPPVLYAIGNLGLLKSRCVCIVGTRRCTDYGKRVANEWSAALSKKFVIVSGHATGIDTYAVKSCLTSGGGAIIVLACGLDKFDPPDYLKKCPADKLLLLSEYPTGTRTAKFSYHERNRLLSGLSVGVVIVEAAKKSGALITADRAAQQNRHVFAVPGDVFSERCRGTNNLLRCGAIPATSAADIFEDLGIDCDGLEKEDIPDMTPEEKKVYDFLSEGKRHFDDITEMLGIPSYETSSLLSIMELEGIIEKKMQNYYSLHM